MTSSETEFEFLGFPCVKYTSDLCTKIMNAIMQYSFYYNSYVVVNSMYYLIIIL